MFGFPGLGGALSAGLSGIGNAYTNANAMSPTGGPSFADKFAKLGNLGQQFSALGQPRFVGQPQQTPGFGLGGIGMPVGLLGMGNDWQSRLPPQVLAALQERLGAASPASWGMGTTATPTPSRFASPQNLIASLFNRGAYQ